MSASGYYTFGAAITAKDLASNVFAQVGDNANTLKEQIAGIKGGVEVYENSMKNLKTGGIMTAAGTGILMASKSMVDAGREAGVLKSNLSSLGLAEEAIQKIDKAAVGMGGSMGIAREDILAASYDIKSGIETIDDNAIGAVAGSIAKAAAATKGDAKQLSSFFGTVYNQNKHLYEGLSDENFADLFANNMSLATKKYKTEGAKMQQAMESISGAAAAAGYDMETQFNVVGMMQNVTNPGEAGTAFRAFVDKSAGAAEKLGMSFTDASGDLLPVTDIMGKLEGKFGHLGKAARAVKIKEAFGSDEAVKLVNGLWGKTDKLNENIQTMRDASGTEVADPMSADNLNNIDTSIKKVAESWTNMKGVMGGGMGTVLKPFFDAAATGLSYLAQLGTDYPVLMSVVGGTVALGGVLLTLGGTIVMVKGALGMYKLSQLAAANATNLGTVATKKSIFAKGISAIKTGALTAATWAKNTAISTGTAITNLHIGAHLKNAAVTTASTVKTGFFTAATWAKTAAISAGTVATNLAAAAQWALNAAFVATPIGWIVLGLAAIVAGGIALYKNFDLVKEKVAGAWDWIKGKWDAAITFFTGLGAKIQSKLSDAWTNIKNKWSEAPGWIKLVIGAAILTITGPIGAVVAAGVAVYKNWDLIKTKGVAAWGAITTKVTGAYAAFTGFVGGIRDKIFAIPGYAKAAGSGLVTAFVSGFAEKVEWMKEKMSAGFGLVKKLFPHSDAPEGPFSNLTASGRSVVTTFESGIEQESGRKDPAVKPYMDKSMQSLQGYNTASGSQTKLPANNGGLNLNIQQLVGTLNLNGETREGNIRELADKLAELLFEQVERTHGAV